MNYYNLPSNSSTPFSSNGTRIQYNPRLDIPTTSFYTEEANFPSSHSKESNKQLSLVREPDMNYSNFVHYVSVSSNNRDSTNYPLHYDYRINFDVPYKNVKCIELISAIFPNQGSILDEPYLIVDSDQINYIDFPDNTGSKPLKGFAVIPIKASTQATNGYINPELGCIYNSSRIYRTPLASLSYLSIKIRDLNGDLFNFGQANGSTDKLYQNNFVFKITVGEVSNNVINQRNVY